MPATDLKIGTFVLIPNFNTHKGISKKLQPLRKGPYQIIAKPTDVTYKLTDSTKKENVQHRNNLLPYYPKEYALPKLTQLYSFTGLKFFFKTVHIQNKKQMYKTTFIINKIKNKTQLIAIQKRQTQKYLKKKEKKQENDRKNSTTRTSRKIRTQRNITTSKSTT